MTSRGQIPGAYTSSAAPHSVALPGPRSIAIDFSHREAGGPHTKAARTIKAIEAVVACNSIPSPHNATAFHLKRKVHS